MLWCDLHLCVPLCSQFVKLDIRIGLQKMILGRSIFLHHLHMRDSMDQLGWKLVLCQFPLVGMANVEPQLALVGTFPTQLELTSNLEGCFICL